MTSVKNICILTYSLGRGGAEKVAAIQSQMLNGIGYNVFMVSVLNDIQYKYSGKLLNLGIFKDEKDGFLPRIQRLRTINKLLSFNKKAKTIFMVYNSLLHEYFPQNKYVANFLYKKQPLICISTGVQKKQNSIFNF